MKTLTKITLLCAFLSVIVHAYLALHYYPIKFGFSTGPSICSVNAKFDCDAVAASNYSSAFDIPLAVWGGAVNLIIFILILSQAWGWTDHPERLRRWSLIMVSLNLLASLVMGVISLARLNNYCLMCISLYVLSIFMFACYRRTLEEPFFSNLGNDVSYLWAESRGILVAFAAIPVLAYVAHYSFLETYGVSEVGNIVRTTIEDWKFAPQNTLSVTPSLVAGPAKEKAALLIQEFADFRCGHCRHAFPSLDNFVKSHSDVRFEFYNFPLDGDCNEKFGQKNGMSCRLAEAVQCAEKQNSGWPLHHALFNAQDETIKANSVAEMDDKIKAISEPLGIKSDQLFQCMNDPQTKDAIRMQAKQGDQVKVQGTPAIYVNGRELQRGQLIPVLEAAKEYGK
jgi:protein-disulfide isomerase/uncharacterized membrane protein